MSILTLHLLYLLYPFIGWLSFKIIEGRWNKRYPEDKLEAFPMLLIFMLAAPGAVGALIAEFMGWYNDDV